MYNIIIVDNEYASKREVEQLINWNDFGFEIVNVFSDSFSALNYLANHKVDLLITDIDLPIMNGLQLIETIKSLYNSTYCVVISGQQTLEYARKLIKLGVLDYLAKPASTKALAKLLKSIKVTLDQKLEQEQLLSQKDAQLKSMQLLCSQQFFIDLFLQKPSYTLVQKSLDQHDFGFDPSNTNVFYAQIKLQNLQEFLDSKWKYGIDALYDSITNFILSHKTNFKLIHFLKNRTTLCIIARFDKGQSLEEQHHILHQFLTNSILNITEFSAIELTLTSIQGYLNFANICNNVTDIERIYVDESDVSIISAKELPLNDMSSDQLTYLFNAINSAFISHDLDDVYERLDLLHSKIKHLLLSDARDTYISLIHILTRQLGTDNESVIHYENTLMDCNDIYDMKIYTKKYIDLIRNQIAYAADSQLYLLIDQSKKYIETNYHKNISRNDVANYMFLSPSYFSRCFKQETGMKFIDYLTSYRIEKSCELLLDSSKNISDVCDAIGYNSPSYFTRVFKNIMGVTPREYICANITE